MCDYECVFERERERERETGPGQVLDDLWFKSKSIFMYVYIYIYVCNEQKKNAMSYAI